MIWLLYYISPIIYLILWGDQWVPLYFVLALLKCFPWKCGTHLRPSQKVCHLHRQKQLIEKHKKQLALHFKKNVVWLSIPFFPELQKSCEECQPFQGWWLFYWYSDSIDDGRSSELHWFVLENRWGRQCNIKNDRTQSAEERQEDRNWFP